MKQAWLDAAVDPSTIECVFAMDDDDADSLRATTKDLRAVNSGGMGVTSVRNWNAAAAMATGDLLVVVADDLFPPPGWDRTLQDLVSGLDPRQHAFAIKLGDSPEDNRSRRWPMSRLPSPLLRHPAVSRAHYTKLGLFSPKFSGVFCDNDITLRAFWKAVILDGRALGLNHRHPTLDAGYCRSDSQRLVNTATEYQRGKETFRDLWPRWRRDLPTLLLALADGCVMTDRSLWVQSRWLRVQSLGRYALERARAAIWLISHPRTLAARTRRRRGVSD